jgi:hypothetical protein
MICSVTFLGSHHLRHPLPLLRPVPSSQISGENFGTYGRCCADISPVGYKLEPLYNLNLARLLDRNGIGQYSTVASIRALAQRSLSTRASVSFRFTLRESLACAHRLDQL